MSGGAGATGIIRPNADVDYYNHPSGVVAVAAWRWRNTGRADTRLLAPGSIALADTGGFNAFSDSQDAASYVAALDTTSDIPMADIGLLKDFKYIILYSYRWDGNGGTPRIGIHFNGDPSTNIVNTTDPLGDLSADNHFGVHVDNAASGGLTLFTSDSDTFTIRAYTSAPGGVITLDLIYFIPLTFSNEFYAGQTIPPARDGVTVFGPGAIPDPSAYGLHNAVPIAITEDTQVTDAPQATDTDLQGYGAWGAGERHVIVLARTTAGDTGSGRVGALESAAIVTQATVEKESWQLLDLGRYDLNAETVDMAAWTPTDSPAGSMYVEGYFPVAALAIECSSATIDTITVDWEPAPSGITGYNLYIFIAPGGWVLDAFVNGGDPLTWTFASLDLQPGTYYPIRVDAVDGVGVIYATASTACFTESVTPPPPTPSTAEPADVPSLDVCGVEISNPARAFSYLENGLGGPNWRTRAGCIPTIYFDDGSSEPLVFTDVAGSDGGSPAPWYDPAHPDSEEFLGVLLTSLDGFDSTVSRTVTQRAGGIQGGSIGSQHLDARVLTMRGFLVASSCCGLEFGRRWLINTLSAAPCDPCGLCDITVRTCPPPADGSDDDRGRWNLYDVALVDGPHETDRAECCDWAEFDATLTAGNPFLYKQKQTCVTATQLQPDTGGSDCMAFEDWFCGPPSDKICCTVDPPLVGTLGAIVTIDASQAAVGGVEVGTYVNCPPGDSDTPVFSLTIPLLVAGSILVIDSARRVITYTAPDGSVQDGTQFIAFPEGRSMDWIEVSDCSPATCICVNAEHPCSGGDQVYVTIETQRRVR
jgi:hypothetical protein